MPLSIFSSERPARRLGALTALWCAAFLALYGFAVSLWPDGSDIAGTIGGNNSLIAQRFIYDHRAMDAVVIGSSLSARLPVEELGADIFNLALSGEGASTGAAILHRKGEVPQRIVVETNQIYYGVDNALVDGLFAEPQHTLRGLFPMLQEKFRPQNVLMGAVKRLIHGIRTGLAPKAASIEADEEAKQRMVEAVRVQFQAPIDAASVDGAIYALKAVLDRLKATGAEIFLFQMPTSPAVDESPRTAVIRARTDAILPPALYPRFDLSALGKVDTVDGVHLIHPDAVRAAALLRSQIEKAPRGGLP